MPSIPSISGRRAATRASRGAVAAAALALGLAATALPAPALAEGLFTSRGLTLETATKAAQAALEACRKAGYQVGVAVVDRAGVTQVFLRDRFAGPHTATVAVDKAWTAASFRIPTAELGSETQSGKPMSGLRALPRMMAIGGGLPIEAAGSTVGAIGVSGAPGGEADDACARAGIEAILIDIEL